MYEHDITVGPIEFTGATDQTNLIDSFNDWSRFQSVRGELSVTAAASTAADTLGVKVQSKLRNEVTWNTRMYFPLILGTLDPDATTPEVYILNLQNRVVIDSTEESYEATGSEGAQELADGKVRNGPFPGRDTEWRVLWEVEDDSGSADFTAELHLIFGH